MTGAGLRGVPALLLVAICRGVISEAAFLRPLASAVERSTRSDSCFPGSTQLGPPFLYTPVYVDCMEERPSAENAIVLVGMNLNPGAAHTFQSSERACGIALHGMGTASAFIHKKCSRIAGHALSSWNLT